MRFIKVQGSILSIAAPRAPYFEFHSVHHSARLGPYRASPTQLSAHVHPIILEMNINAVVLNFSLGSVYDITSADRGVEGVFKAS